MDYQLKRETRSRNIKIRLDADGFISVSAPRFTPKFLIDQFVNQSADWIERQQRKLKLKQTANPSLNWNEGVVSYLGKLYSIKFRETGDKVSFDTTICWVHPITGAEGDLKKTLLTWLKHQAETDIMTRTKVWAEKMKVRFGTVRFGQQVSRWGSCTQDNNLRFNWRLIHFPPEVIDYVVIHELSHTVHHDHSERFWRLVAECCPTWMKQRKFLHRQSVTVEK